MYYNPANGRVDFEDGWLIKIEQRMYNEKNFTPKKTN
jgi:hypothetical protein